MLDKKSLKTILKYIMPLKYQLTAIAETQKEILQRITVIEENRSQIPEGYQNNVETEFDNNIEINNDFPLASLQDVNIIEEKLQADADGVYKACLVS